MTADDDNTHDWNLATEHYVRACIRAISDSITREVRKGLGQCDVGVRRRGSVIDEINEEIDEAQERLEKAYRRRAQYSYRADERRE